MAGREAGTGRTGLGDDRQATAVNSDQWRTSLNDRRINLFTDVRRWWLRDRVIARGLSSTMCATAFHSDLLADAGLERIRTVRSTRWRASTCCDSVAIACLAAAIGKPKLLN